MDGKTFDDLTRTAVHGATRRGALGLLTGAALAAGLAKFDLTAAKKGKGKNKKKKCRKANQSCGGKKKCCKGHTCTNGTCLAPSEPECVNDNDCGANEICQNGVCAPEQPECDNDNDCDNDEVCDDGVCVPEPAECVVDSDCGSSLLVCENGECVFEPECESNSDCEPDEVCNGGICFGVPS